MGWGNLHLTRIGRGHEDHIELLANDFPDIGWRLGRRLLGLLHAHELGHWCAAVGEAARAERECAGEQCRMSNDP
jgi:hypothetical protein